jgi:uncharacterized protein
LLHDIERSKTWKKNETKTDNHGIDGAKKARRFLLSLNMKRSDVDEICKAISTHCFPYAQKTIIAKILWDADKLSLFSQEMEKEHVKYWESRGLCEEEAKKQIEKERNFYMNTFNTRAAKDIATSLRAGGQVG